MTFGLAQNELVFDTPLSRGRTGEPYEHDLE